MKTSIKWMIGLGAAAVTFIVLACILFFTAINVNDIKKDVLNNGGVIFNKSRVKDIALEESKPIEGIDKIEIEIGSGDVKIIETDEENLKAAVNGRYYNISDSSEGYSLELNKTGNVLTLKITHDWKFLNIGSFFIGDIKIEVPKTFGGALDLEVGSGSADFRVNNEFSDFKLVVHSGSVTLQNLNVATTQNLDIIADMEIFSGDLTISDCDIKGNLKMTIHSGYANIKGKFETLNAKVYSGEADIEVEELKGNYTIEVSSGDFKLTLPSNASYKISGFVSSGYVRDKKTNKWYYRAFSDGIGVHKIEINVSSGYAEIN